MKIYLVRHGIAELRSPDKEDAERILTKKGIAKTQKVAEKLSQKDIQFDVIITSPYVRARETAIILQKAKLSKEVVEHPALMPEGNLLELLHWLQTSPYHNAETMAWVGHQPDLSQWAELLLWGRSEEKIILKKAGIIGLNVPDLNNPLGRAEMFLLVSPKWIID